MAKLKKVGVGGPACPACEVGVGGAKGKVGTGAIYGPGGATATMQRLPDGSVDQVALANWAKGGQVANRWFKASYFNKPAAATDTWVHIDGAVPGMSTLHMSHGRHYQVEIIQLMGQNDTLMALVAGWSLPKMPGLAVAVGGQVGTGAAPSVNARSGATWRGGTGAAGHQRPVEIISVSFSPAVQRIQRAINKAVQETKVKFIPKVFKMVARSGKAMSSPPSVTLKRGRY
jgi:hypothetical protein